jgi:colanic acid/amylovoran biosynthesis protein
MSQPIKEQAMTKKYIMYAHGGSLNHGCEAIAISTSSLLPRDGRIPVLWSYHADEDIQAGLRDIIPDIIDVTLPGIERISLDHLVYVFGSRIRGHVQHYVKKGIESAGATVETGDVALSIGGDNYCYPGTPPILSGYNRYFKRKGAKTVLWGCSIEPDLLKSHRIIRDLSRYDLIIARESITYQSLKNSGLNTVHFCPDPAFVLPEIREPLPAGFIEGNTIGLNLSPLIERYAQNKDILFENSCTLIEHVLKTSSFSIALIPHVLWKNDSDLSPLSKLHTRYKYSGRVVLIEKGGCQELKGYISRCTLFIGARTHATIAAYSSCVPTLVLGYSVKSRGIAKDIFGTYEKYTLPVDMISTADSMVKAFDWLRLNETVIRSHLAQTMPDYISKANNAGELLKKL